MTLKPVIGSVLATVAAMSFVGQITSAQTVEVVVPDGADEGLQGRLEGASLALTLGDGRDATAQDYVAAARADYRRLLTGLYAAGYYGGTVSILVDGREASGIAPLDAPGQINQIVMSVDPGPRFTFGEASVAPLPPETILPEGFAAGETARSGLIQTATQAAISSWRDAGYALARADGQQITANHPSQTLDAAIAIDTGARLAFGEVTITGNEAVRTERVREIAGIPYDAFSPNELNRAAARLRRTGTFSSVTIIEGDTAGPDQTLPLEIQVVEQAPRRLGFGAEFSTIDEATLSAFWLHRNFRGGAERFRLEGAVSGLDGGTGGIDYRIGATYGRPATLRPDIDLLASLAFEHENEPNFLLDSLSGDIGLTRYRSEILTIGAAIGFVTAREETDLRTRYFTLLTAPLTASYDRRDAPLNPTSGFYIDLAATPFFDLGGDSESAGSGARLFADVRGYRSVGEGDRLTFAGRFQLGSVVGADLDEAPADFLFFSGGGGTVRGQPYQSLGIDTTQDLGAGPVTTTSGGASFAGLQLEARYNVTDAIGLVGFYDAGLIGEDPLPSSGDEWHAGAGIGVRYNTGIGPIRFDIGTPVQGDTAGDNIEVYIGIGQSF